MNLRFPDGRQPPAAFACPVCSDPDPKPFVAAVDSVQPASLPERELQLYRCDRCQSLTYHPFPEIDYTQHTASELTVRDYVEFNGAIDLVARNLLRVIPDGSGTGRLLDIGCGFGFGMDAIRSIAGWEVRGYEPSHYGKLGREQLGLDIVSDFAAKNNGSSALFDIVHCSEVIEHINDPGEFVGILASYLKDDGVLVLTTPDAARIARGTDPSTLLALLSPGAHTILYSAEGLAQVLRSAGFAHVEIDRSAASMLVYASRAPLRFQQRSPQAVAERLHRHLRDRLSRAAPGSSLEIGLRYRLFRGALDAGDYPLAEAAFTPRLADAAPRLDDIETPAQFAARWPICIAASTYYLGMLMLLHRGDYPGAARHFRAAARLCQTKMTLSAATAVVETDLIWRAVYHEALALSYAGELLRALARLASFVDFGGEASPPVPANLHAPVLALRNKLAELGDEVQKAKRPRKPWPF
ncbi:hypothetical protein K32_43740 [Kaistia sp. 32K]|uniref:class I SAM-dependent methyltransferase n=1 Tax=Kaistia sp. 32K TaxID=2795690 RepID=UPI0019154B42|nr:class I SAM-dependent methyltransferase [Kaistia sp. 32K]BCP55757.1 hypothetical protein K32_43740 [Kaistia sp. 32K]